MSETIGFIGLGNMGMPMAQNLLGAGFALRVYNRTPEKAQPLVDQGAHLCNTPGEVADRPDAIVVSMLADDRAAEEVVFGESGLLERLGVGGVHLSMSTIAPVTTRKLSEAHRARNSVCLAAPVFGRPDAAATQKLWICLAGEQSARLRTRPLLEAMGQGIFEFGDTPEASNVVKLAGNFMLLSALEAMAEAFTLAQKYGIERTQMAELFGQTLFACPVYQNYGQMIAREQYEPAGFKLSLGLKDITLALDTAAAAQMPMPLASLLHDRLISSVARGRGNLDWSGFALAISEDAGLGTNSEVVG